MPDITLRLNTAPPNFPLNISLRGVPPAEETESIYAEVYGRFDDEPDAEPIYLGSGVSGGTVTAVGLDLGSRPFRLFLRPRNDSQLESVTDLRQAEQIVFSPNTETLTPVIYESAPATNTKVTITVGNYSALSRFREIQTSLNSGFTSPVVLPIQGVVNEAGGLDPEVSITRSTNLSVAENRYIRVRHSSNGTTFGEWSNVQLTTYANSGGSGGSGGSPPPPTGGSDPDNPLPCFSGDTIFHLYDEETTFADLYRRNQVGFDALSFNNGGETVRGKIIKLFKSVAKNWLYVEFSDGERFEVKAGHKFFTESGYVAIRDLQIGDRVVNADGTLSELTVKKECFGVKEFFNTHIDEFMNYCVGRTKKRVHNLKDINE